MNIDEKKNTKIPKNIHKTGEKNIVTIYIKKIYCYSILCRGNWVANNNFYNSNSNFYIFVAILQTVLFIFFCTDALQILKW